jgi:succinate dehydrogenase / fumarate reductase, membrane anchor subunit
MLAAPKPGENVWLWLLKLVTGLLMILLLFVHLVMNHLVVEGGLMTHADVVRYFTNPWVVMMEVTFLVVVVSHSLIGMRSIVMDLRPSAGLIRSLDWIFILVGSVAVIYGVWLTQSIVAYGAGVDVN